MKYTPILLMCFLVACTQVELQPVDMQLKWVHQAQFAGNYVAKDTGIYEKHGLDVTMHPFSFETYPIDAVESGDMEFGITGADELLIAKQSGKAVNTVAIAVVYKINPVCLYSLSESGISKPADFVGKTIGIERAADGTEINIGQLYMAMMNKQGIDRDQVTEVTIGYDATELLAGDTDVSSGYIINEPFGVISAGKEVSTILVADYGVNMYADVIITNKNLIKSNPDLVESFLRASLEGWQYAIENEEETVQITLNYADSNHDHQLYMLESSIPLIHTGKSSLGWMEKSNWEEAQNILTAQNIMPKRIDVSQVYDMTILNKIYK